jgi:hypothetical protein
MRRFVTKMLWFVPLLALIAAVNRTIDPARFYGTHFLDPSRDRYEGTVIDNLLAARSQALLSPYNERIVHDAVFRSNRPIDVVALGASVAKPINSGSFPGQQLYNASIYGGELEESAAVYQLAWEAGRRPKRVVIEMHGRELAMRNWDVLEVFAPVMLRVRKRLGLPEDETDSAREALAHFTNRIRPDEQSTAAQFTADQTWLHPYDKLFSPRYFQFSVRSATKDWLDQPSSTDGTAANAVQPEDDRQTLYPDGSVQWPGKWLSQTPQQIRRLVQSDGFKPNLDHGPALSPDRCRLFDAFVSELEKAGIEVELVLVPPFPPAFDRLRTLYEEAHQPYPITECEAYLRAFAKKHRIQIDGSLDPRLAKVKEEEYVDYIHMRREGIGRLIVGGDGQQIGN